MSPRYSVASVLLVLLLAVCLEQSEAFRVRFRGRRLWRSIKKPLCSAACALTCTTVTSGAAAPVCSIGCRRACGRKRRSVQELFESDEAIEVIPMSREFDHYDINEDGYVTIQEFAEALGVADDSGDVRTAFDLADKSGDDMLAEDELQEAPFVFEEGEEHAAESLGDEITK